MKKVETTIEIAFNWKDKTVDQVSSMAGGVITQLAVDPVIHVDAGLTTVLGEQKVLLDATIKARLTNSSKDLTLTEGLQSTDVMNTVELIGAQVQAQANALTPGNAVAIGIIYARIGFDMKGKAGGQDRGFEVYETFYKGVKIRIKAEKAGTTYNFRWSIDGITFKEILAGNVSHLSITDLPASTKIWFQYAITSPMGKNAIVSADAELEWSDPISGTTK